MNRLRELRTRFLKTQTEIGEYIGMSQSGYGNYEQGRCTIPRDLAEQLAGYYNVTLDYLLGYDFPIEDDKIFRKFNKLLPETRTAIYAKIKYMIDRAYDNEFKN